MAYVHGAIFNDAADAVEVVAESPHGQAQHLDLRLRPFGPEHNQRLAARVRLGVAVWRRRRPAARPPCGAAVGHRVQLHGQLAQFAERRPCRREDLPHLPENLRKGNILVTMTIRVQL